MRFFLAAGLLALTLGVGIAAPIPKGQAKNPWVGKFAFVKAKDVKLHIIQADGTESAGIVGAGVNVFYYTVSKVGGDRIEISSANSDRVYYFQRDDVLKATDAIEFYTTKLKDAPKDTFYLALRAWANYAEDKFDAAEADCTTALNVETNSPTVLRIRAIIRLGAKKFEGAIEDFDKLIAQWPNDEWAIRQRASAKASLKKYDEAIAEYTKLLATTGNRNDVLIGRGLAYDHSGQHAKALADYEEILKSNPKSAVAWNNKAWLRCTCPEAKFRNGKEAVELATKACELTEWANAGYLDTLAAAYAEQGDFEKAMKWQREAMQDKELMKREDGEITARLELYKQKKPYRQPVAEKK
ncbi:tetratricopeptide repeat protein [Limnoglobus roseus]|uniref:Tetratricopeptide repeat-containing protein n=1 Tax=Limnoglobus roseus TaxID=2598579 RepID=A0A5C1AB47_9BACT|nr:tetratricopeptide repeat protein [Limnoglobus roseus]QEL14354.1 tetratricopeptide repeat-containing protein [Limnoglobus roseus]